MPPSLKLIQSLFSTSPSTGNKRSDVTSVRGQVVIFDVASTKIECIESDFFENIFFFKIKTRFEQYFALVSYFDQKDKFSKSISWKKILAYFRWISFLISWKSLPLQFFKFQYCIYIYSMFNFLQFFCIFKYRITPYYMYHQARVPLSGSCRIVRCVRCEDRKRTGCKLAHMQVTPSSAGEWSLMLRFAPTEPSCDKDDSGCRNYFLDSL